MRPRSPNSQRPQTFFPERSVVPALGSPDSGARPVGVPLVARDAYGSRFLVAAPFGYEAGVPDHWYAWDVDACWAVSVTGAGTFGSADEAMAEWRGSVGAGACSELSPGNFGLVAGLLRPCLQTGVFADMLHGDEPRELIREMYRMRRRACALPGRYPARGTAHSPTGTRRAPRKWTSSVGRGAHRAFRAWYRARHPDAPKGIVATADTIIGEWGPGRPLDERSFYACSPFRVAMTAHLIGNDYEPSYANRAIRLLPEWTQWCAEQSGIPENLAEPVHRDRPYRGRRARQAGRSGTGRPDGHHAVPSQGVRMTPGYGDAPVVRRLYSPA